MVYATLEQGVYVTPKRWYVGTNATKEGIMDGFWATDRQPAYDAAARVMVSPSGRVMLADVSLDEAARAYPGLAIKVVNVGALV